MLKKILTLIVIMGVLTACSKNEAAKNSQEALQTETEVNQVNPQENDQLKEVQEDAKENVNQNEWISLPEYNKIIEQVGKEDIDFEMVTDNEEKRVLNILDKDGSIQYKSIFIKDTNRLKIINVKNDGQIFNEIL